MRKKIANGRDELANTKGKLFGDLKFTLMDLCAGPERRLEAEARAPLLANARTEPTPRPPAPSASFSSPRSISLVHADATATSTTARDAVRGIIRSIRGRARRRRCRRRRRAPSTAPGAASTPQVHARRAKSFIDPRRTSHELIAVDDSTTFDDLASERRRSKTSNRAVGARVGHGARPRAATAGARPNGILDTPTSTLARDRWNE